MVLSLTVLHPGLGLERSNDERPSDFRAWKTLRLMPSILLFFGAMLTTPSGAVHACCAQPGTRTPTSLSLR
jgi:hypothetical protein